MSQTNQEIKRYGSEEERNFFGMPIHGPVFYCAAGLILALVALGIWQAQWMERTASAMQAFIADHLGWFYMGCMNVFLVFSVYLIFSRYGSIRLGGEDAEKEFSEWGWYAMLFAAGTGVGLLFYGVAEPISFFAAPPFGEAQTVQAARDAMVQTIYHWGLHGWSMYALVGLAMGFFCYNRGLPLTVRSAFQPLLKQRVHGPIGNAIDIMAVVGTLIGVAVSLGLGVQQMNTGLNLAFGMPDNMGVQQGLIAGITAVATISVVSGLARGIQLLSKLAMLIGAALVVYVLVVGPTTFLFDALLENIGSYIQQLPSRGTYMEAYGRGQWQNQWTLFYFAWWITWSPFVGMFIARVSKGRTLRQYLLGVLLIPTLVSIIWLTVIGGSALHHELYGAGGLVEAVQSNVTTGMFAFLESFAVSQAVITTTFIMMILAVAIFFVTSSDSGSLVIDIMSSGGDPEPPTGTRVFWAVLEGVVAAILLFVGGLGALSAVATVAGLPFAAIILAMCPSLYLGLKREWAERGY